MFFPFVWWFRRNDERSMIVMVEGIVGDLDQVRD